MSSRTVFGQPISRIIVGTAALAGSVAFLIYLLRKSRNENLRDGSGGNIGSETPAIKAARLKEEGNREFGARHYSKAADLFAQAIEVLKKLDECDSKTNALSVLYNNYSACMEFQDNWDKALEYSSLALELNSDYLKPYIRRARIYKQKNQLSNSLFDYGTIIRLLNKDGQFAIGNEVEKYLTLIIMIAKDIVTENAVKLMKSRIDQENFLPISQSNIVEWSCNAIHDPLLNRMKELGTTKPEDPLDLALYNLKNRDYNNVLPLSFEVATNQNVDIRKRFLGRLLSARIYQFAGLKHQLQFMFHMINELWDHSVESELVQNLELWDGNADAFIILSIYYHRSMSFGKAFKMLDYAKKVEPNRPYIEYYEIATNFAEATRNQDVARVHQITTDIDSRIRNVPDVSEHAVILAARIFAVSNNSAYALEVLRNHKAFKDERNIGIQLLYTVIKHDHDNGATHSMAEFEQELQQLLTKDPNNFETLRMLFRCSFDKGDFVEAMEHARNAWHNTRTFEEFSSAYHDLILASSLANIQFPIDEYPVCHGPDYIRANSNENVLRFSDSSSVQ
ncbi:Mitochondrial import receptor subunit TOM70 [Aphelenchoides besseyi]|nr:Mitochondrial import receptor subunit TOM70 [Aphelenchoides besseyi]KAI6201686.1 Mitochondrial import receptor subunit TOM70 [Aphelenchoides besseyi]